MTPIFILGHFAQLLKAEREICSLQTGIPLTWATLFLAKMLQAGIISGDTALVTTVIYPLLPFKKRGSLLRISLHSETDGTSPRDRRAIEGGRCSLCSREQSEYETQNAAGNPQFLLFNASPVSIRETSLSRDRGGRREMNVMSARGPCVLAFICISLDDVDASLHEICMRLGET